MVEESAAGLFYLRINNHFVYILYKEYTIQKNVINDIGKAQRFVNKVYGGASVVVSMLGHDPKGLVRFKAPHVKSSLWRVAQLVERSAFNDRLWVQVP